MKKNIAIVSLLAVSIKSALAGPVSPENSLPKDTTKVIDIEEVVVIATPKENNRLRQQATSSTSFSQSAMRNNSVTSSMSITFVVSLGNEFSGDTGPAKALFIETASNETIAIFFFILLKDIV
jgi:hypothetical protein